MTVYSSVLEAMWATLTLWPGNGKIEKGLGYWDQDRVYLWEALKAQFIS